MYTSLKKSLQDSGICIQSLGTLNDHGSAATLVKVLHASLKKMSMAGLCVSGCSAVLPSEHTYQCADSCLHDHCGTAWSFVLTNVVSADMQCGIACIIFCTMNKDEKDSS